MDKDGLMLNVKCTGDKNTKAEEEEYEVVRGIYGIMSYSFQSVFIEMFMELKT